jgi:hypothetical protein
MFWAVNRSRLGALVLPALGGALCLWIGLRPTVTTVDRNGDGRVDLWEYHDGPFGTVTKIVEDTNFDGRPDRFSYIVDGVLRRESDANFDGRVDQVEECDVDGNRTRTVRDTDRDGIADLLILYRDGVPVYSQRADADQLATRVPSQHGGSLVDPFLNETTISRVSRKVDPLAGFTSRLKLYTSAPCRGSPSFRTTLRISAILTERPQVNSRQLFPRGPPASDSAPL